MTGPFFLMDGSEVWRRRLRSNPLIYTGRSSVGLVPVRFKATAVYLAAKLGRP